MVKIETITVKKRENMYYCDGCGAQLGAVDDLKVHKVQSITLTRALKSFYGDVTALDDPVTRYLCDKCFKKIWEMTNFKI